METIKIKVNGMTCAGCTAAVERVLRALEGVTKVSVSLNEGEATVEFESSQVGREDLRAAIEDAGYDAA